MFETQRCCLGGRRRYILPLSYERADFYTFTLNCAHLIFKTAMVNSILLNNGEVTVFTAKPSRDFLIKRLIQKKSIRGESVTKISRPTDPSGTVSKVKKNFPFFVYFNVHAC